MRLHPDFELSRVGCMQDFRSGNQFAALPEKGIGISANLPLDLIDGQRPALGNALAIVGERRHLIVAQAHHVADIPRNVLDCPAIRHGGFNQVTHRLTLAPVDLRDELTGLRARELCGMRVHGIKADAHLDLSQVPLTFTCPTKKAGADVVLSSLLKGSPQLPNA